ncbi:MAG: hypothetical protein ISR52_03745 [Rhodospirillales bacterium]|nr:hypothetical protein [Rhodospirillales bacterium]
MVITLAVLAFVLAFGAVCFAGEAMKRISAYTQNIEKAHLANISKALTEMNQQVTNLDKRLRTVEHQINGIQESRHTLRGLEEQSRRLRDQQDADNFIPSIGAGQKGAA